MKKVSCAQAKELDLVDYLASVGYEPTQIRNHDDWYLSPLRDEKTPSFKVNRNMNRWYDFGEGKGGNIIDFGILYHNCNVKELLIKLSEPFSFQRALLSALESRFSRSAAANSNEAPDLRPAVPKSALLKDLKIRGAVVTQIRK